MKGLLTYEVGSKVKVLFTLVMTDVLDMIRCLHRGLEETNVNLYDEII